MTPNDLLTRLRLLRDDTALIFETPQGPVGKGYHITELKHARITSIDCGARISIREEAALQLLDGQGEKAMTVGKAVKIIAQSLTQVSGLSHSPLHVEFAHGNRGLQLYQLGDLQNDTDTAILKLTEVTAHCKPAMPQSNARARCCAPASTSSRCCA